MGKPGDKAEERVLLLQQAQMWLLNEPQTSL